MSIPLASTTLHCTANGSDKLYTAAIVANPSGGFNVVAQNGPRGGVQTVQKPKALGVDEATARDIYAKLVRSKVAKDYNPIDGDPTALAATNERDGKSANLPVQLLNFVDAREAAALLASAASPWMVQEKKDGERRLLIVSGTDVYGANRKGQFVPLPPAIVAAATALGPDAILDGEQVGDVLHVFDAQKIDGNDLTGDGFCDRYERLAAKLAAAASAAIVLVPASRSDENPAGRIVELRGAGAEGFVLKHGYAPYTDGRPTQGGNALKRKFYNTATVEVVRHNDVHSVGFAVYDNDERIDVGNVTVPPSMRLPAIGALLEVRYLYANRGGSLYQPTFLQVRGDVTTSDCAIAQLVYKGEGVVA